MLFHVALIYFISHSLVLPFRVSVYLMLFFAQDMIVGKELEDLQKPKLFAEAKWQKKLYWNTKKIPTAHNLTFKIHKISSFSFLFSNNNYISNCIHAPKWYECRKERRRKENYHSRKTEEYQKTRDNSEKFGTKSQRIFSELSAVCCRKTIKMWFYKQKTPSNIISETDINIKCDYWRFWGGFVEEHEPHKRRSLTLVNKLINKM